MTTLQRINNATAKQRNKVCYKVHFLKSIQSKLSPQTNQDQVKPFDVRLHVDISDVRHQLYLFGRLWL